MGDRVRMDPETAATVRSEFASLRDLLGTASWETPRDVADLRTAAGEFATDLADGADTFELGWRQVFELGNTASRLVITNVNELSLELTTFDEDAATTLRPGPI